MRPMPSKSRTLSQEGLKMVLRIALIYRPVASELYELETEIGPNLLR